MGGSNSCRRICVHQALGGGHVADVLLWKKWCGGITILTFATTFWYLFERGGYNFSSFVANVLLFLVFILFFWAKSASLLNRPLPPLPDLEIPEELVSMVAEELQFCINFALSIARDIAIGRNLELFLQVALGLLIASFIGSFFSFLTLVYLASFGMLGDIIIAEPDAYIAFAGVLFSLSGPLVYDKYQDDIDEKLCVAHRYVQMQYRKLDENVLSKIPLPLNKDKKMQ